MEESEYEEKILQLWVRGVNDTANMFKTENYIWRNLITGRKLKCYPVRGANGFLVVNRISFSSSIGMGKLMSTCPRLEIHKSTKIVEIGT